MTRSEVATIARCVDPIELRRAARAGSEWAVEALRYAWTPKRLTWEEDPEAIPLWRVLELSAIEDKERDARRRERIEAVLRAADDEVAA